MDLKPGEIICDKCKGEGTIFYPYNKQIRWCECRKCQGDGKVDWIENVVGKEKQDFISGVDYGIKTR
jgi:DnaJ-class molecular chaperone